MVLSYGKWKDALTEDFPLSIGFGFFWSWIWIIFLAHFFSASSADTFSAFSIGQILPIAVYGLTFVFFGILLKSKRIVLHGKTYLAILPIIALVGTVFLYYGEYYALTNIVIYRIVGGILCGVGAAGIHMEWGRLLGSNGPRKTMIHIILGSIIAAFIVVIIALLPIIFSFTICLALPFATMYIYRLRTRSIGQLWKHGLKNDMKVPKKFFFTAVVQGLAFGIGQAFITFSETAIPPVFLVSISLLFAALMVFILAIIFEMDFNNLIYRYGFGLTATGFLLFVFLGSINTSAWIIQSIGYRFIDIMMWSLCAFLVKQKGVSANWIFSFTAVLLISLSIGGCIGYITLSNSSTISLNMNRIACLMLFVILVASLFLSSEKNLAEGWGISKPSDSIDVDASATKMAIDSISRHYKLTPRERDILSFLSKGRNAAFICGELTLSKETVKAHMRNIYRKLDVHSLQDVLDLFEDETALQRTTKG